MTTDERDRLETLKAELDFIEKGGYGRRVRTPWKPTSVFQDSLSCINYGYPYRARPCNAARRERNEWGGGFIAYGSVGARCRVPA